MKALILSDLHLEFEPYEPQPVDFDLVILAGDIHKGVRGVKWANETFRSPVIFVPGNHEYYGGHIDRTLEKMRAASDSHVRVIDQDSFVFGGCRFLGVTSWTDYTATGDVSAAMAVARNSMTDFKVIRVGERYRRLRPDDLIARNRIAREWLTAQLEIPFSGKTVVITHHAPVPEVAGESSDDGHLGASYTNNWSSLISQCDFWIFGHTHCSVDTFLGECRLVSNPKGYPMESTGFDPVKIIEI